MAEWHFNIKRPGDRLRDPVAGTFFTSDATSRPGVALIREGIQNSLDARHADEEVLVRIYLSGKDNAVSASDVAPFFDGAWDHYHSEINGLSNPPDINEDCPFLVFEDEGTTGLTGDISQTEPLDGKQNSFFSFFRAEGLSGKSSKDRGRWGVGKTAFNLASRVSSYFGLTVRSDDGQKLLMGSTVLKHHRINGTMYMPDGWFGIKDDEDEAVMPIEDSDIIEQFSSLFDIPRTDQTGLSVVVPWCDLTDTNVKHAVIRDYYYPILMDQLEVMIEIPSGAMILDEKNILEEIEKSEDLLEEFGPLLDLAIWIRDHHSEYYELNAPTPNEGWKWNDDLIPDDMCEEISAKLDNNEKVAIRIPVHIRKKTGDPKATYFNIFMVRDPDYSGRPSFIREGIVISEVGMITRGIRSIVLAEDEPIAEFLGDSENPSHTQWQHDGEHFKHKYKAGRTCLDFVKRSVVEVLRILSKKGEEEDKELLINIFSAPSLEPSTAKKKTKAKPKTGGKVSAAGGGTDKGRIVFDITQFEDGFHATTTSDAQVTPGDRIKISAAYYRRDRNPWRRYDPLDFEMDKAPISIKYNGLKEIEKKENYIIAEVEDAEFDINVTGFDKNRDLYVNAEKLVRKP